MGDVAKQPENLFDQLEKSGKWFLPEFTQSMENYLSDEHWIRPEMAKFILSGSRTHNARQLARVREQRIMESREIVEKEMPKKE